MTFKLRLLFAFVLVAAFVMASEPVRRGHRKTTDERVYLVHSDELRYNRFGPNPDAQIAKGRVHFSHKGGHLYCDSAYYYQGSNSFRAFGHVRYVQGDTLSLHCDKAWYDGAAQMLEARNNVVLRHRQQRLYTDSLNFDRLYGSAYFFRGGRLVEGKTKLSSDWGEYNTNDRQAVFYYDVQLQSPNQRVSTDTLYWDTRKSLAHVVGMYTPNRGNGTPCPSVLHSKNSVVNTTDGYFNTSSDHGQLFGRSTIVDGDKTITADTLLYDSRGGSNAGYGRVVYVDKKNKNKLTSAEVHYNEKTGKGFATGRALVMYYSDKDTLYMHSDTMRVETFHINTDSVYRKVHCYAHVKAFRNDFQAVCDSLVYNTQDSCMTMYKDPITWSDGRQLTGELIHVYTNDSTIRKAHVEGQSLSIELMPDSIHYNQLSSRNLFAYFIDGNIRRIDAVGNVRAVFYPTDSKDSTLIGLNYVETDTMRMFVSPERKLERIWMPKAVGTLYPMTQIPPGQEKLEVFAWFDYVRPTDKDDVFNWRGKASGTEIRRIERHAAPLQTLPKSKADLSDKSAENNKKTKGDKVNG